MLRRRLFEGNGRGRQRGLSIVETMVGVAVGLFVVAAATLVVSSQLTSNRRLLLDTQLQQDLRATADIITRQLRRAEALNEPRAATTVWYANTPAVLVKNFGSTIVLNSPSDIAYKYYRANQPGNYGFQLVGSVIKTRIDNSSPQPLTDDNVLRITSLVIAPITNPAVQIPCPQLCPGGGTACWPTLTVRSFTIEITGEAVGDQSIKRSIHTRVRLPNDLVTNNSGLTTGICPA